MINFIRRFKLELFFVVLYVVFHAPELGRDTFNTDVWKWKVRSYDFSTGVFTFDFAKTLQKYHPGVPLMWIGTIGIKINNLITDQFPNLGETTKIFLLNTIQKYVLISVLAITFVFTLYALRNIFSGKFAIISALLLILEPFNLGLTREFHLEGLMSGFMLASAVWLYYYILDRQRPKRLYISAVFGALTILTKSSGVYILLFAVLIFALLSIAEHHNRKNISAFIKWFLFVIFFFVLAWPAMWVIPIEALTEMFRGAAQVGVDTEHIQYYFGYLVGNPGPTFYPVVLLLRISPALLVGLVGLCFIYKKLDNHKKLFINYIFLYVVFYLLEITLPEKKLDRYVLPALVALTLCAAVFYDYVYDHIKYHALVKPLLFVLFALFPVLYLKLDYLSYFNPLFGGLKTGLKVLEPKWMIGQREIIVYFKNLASTEKYDYSGDDDSYEELIYRNPRKNVLSVGFPEKYYTQIWPFFREQGQWAIIQDITPFANTAKYFVEPVWDDSAKHENRFKLSFVDTIKIRGVVVYNVYKREF